VTASADLRLYPAIAVFPFFFFYPGLEPPLPLCESSSLAAGTRRTHKAAGSHHRSVHLTPSLCLCHDLSDRRSPGLPGCGQ
jgi:hypothetical protein